MKFFKNLFKKEEKLEQKKLIINLDKITTFDECKAILIGLAMSHTHSDSPKIYVNAKFIQDYPQIENLIETD